MQNARVETRDGVNCLERLKAKKAFFSVILTSNSPVSETHVERSPLHLNSQEHMLHEEQANEAMTSQGTDPTAVMVSNFTLEGSQ